MSTTIEQLELEISQNSAGAISGIDALTSSLKKLKNATKNGLGFSAVINDVKNANLDGVKAKLEGLVDTLSPLANLTKSNLSSFITPLKSLPKVFAELNKVDMVAFGAKIKEVATAMKPLGDEMQKVANGFSAMPGKIQRLLKETNKIPTSNKKAASSFTDLYHKIKVGFNTVKKIADVIGDFVTKSMNYTENLNLFTVSLGEYAAKAQTYAESLEKKLGIDSSEWMRAQGVFMTLAKGFGVASDKSYLMSKNLTQLGYDLSSFFNISVEDAMQKLQAGLAGELEPLRRLGFDLSQAKLEAIALEKGIDKTVSSMTQSEKAQLRYYAILTQVTDTHGDLARTLDAPANQFRVLKAQINVTAREIGNIFIPVLSKVLPYLIAITKAVGSLAKILASLVGYEAYKPKLPELDPMKETADGTSEALSDALDSAKKLKNYMMGFDELNVIDPTSGVTDDLGGIFDIDLPEYNFLEGFEESKSEAILTKMKEWLGITEDISSWSELLDTRLGNILKTVGLIGVGIAAWKVTDTFMSSISLISALLGKQSNVVAISAILTITGLVLSFDGIKSAIEDGLGGLDFAEIVGGSLLTTGGAAVLGAKLATWISTAFTSGAIDLALTQAGINLGLGTIGATGAALASAFAGIILGIPAYFVGIYDACKEGIDWLSGTLITLGATAAGAGIGALIGSLGGPVGAGVGALIGLAVGLLTDFGIWLWQNFDEVTKKFYNKVISPIVDFFALIFEPVISIYTYIYTKIEEIVGGIGIAIWSITSKVTEIFLKIVEIFVALGKAAHTYIIKPIVDFVSGIANVVYEEAIKPILDFFVGVGKWIDDNIINPIINGIIWVKDEAIKLFKNIGISVVDFISNLFKSVINGILSNIETRINKFISMLNGAISIINNIPGVNITKVELLSIPRLAEGGFPEQGQMFIAREAGAEMVGSIGRRTAVANNDQIVGGIASGVASANEEQNALLREQNSLLRAILEKDSGVYLDGKNLANSVEKYQRERGRILITGGVL